MNISVSRALTEKARLTEKIEDCRALVVRWNAVEPGTRRPVSVQESLAEMEVLEENLLRVKAALNAANVGIARRLAELMDVRGQIAFYERLDTDETKVARDDEGKTVKVPIDVAVSQVDVIAKVKELRKRLDAIQDEVDEYNATHRVDVELI